MSVIPAKPGFKFGADPEVFITDPSGRYVSAEGLIPGTKESPHPVEMGAVQVDGMAAEFNIDPVSDFETFNTAIVTVMKQLKAFLPTGYKLSIVPSVEFDAEVFDSAPEHAKELGCSPDLNAWTQNLNSPPELVERPRLRCAGGHLHIGWNEDPDFDIGSIQHFVNCCDMVKQLDWYLGAWSINQDPDTDRRSLYGKAGACRIKPYGVEYRVLSNFWLSSKTLRLATWNRMQLAINDMRNRFMPDRYGEDVNNLLVDSINSSALNPTLSASIAYPIATLSSFGR